MQLSASIGAEAPAPALPSVPDCRWLARALKRHYTFARRCRIGSPNSGFGTVSTQPNALIYRVYLNTKAKRHAPT